MRATASGPTTDQTATSCVAAVETGDGVRPQSNLVDAARKDWEEVTPNDDGAGFVQLRSGRLSVKAGPLVLVVDPDDDSRTILATCIRHVGYEVVEAANAAAGLEAARRLLPRLIVGEHPILMADGGVLCDVLKRDSATALIPFLAITSRITPQERKSAESGHYRVLAKPLRLVSVLDAISEALESDSP